MKTHAEQYPRRFTFAAALATTALLTASFIALASPVRSEAAVHRDVTNAVADSADDLTRQVERYSALSADDYTRQSWSDFVPVLGDATDVEAMSDDTAQRDAAAEALRDAVADLVMIRGLSDLVAEFEDRDEDDFDAEAWAVLQNSLSQARTVIADDQASEDSVVLAKNALQDAAAELVPLDGGEFHSIQNSSWWHDTDGNPIYSQGGGVFSFGDRYYWYGVEYEAAPLYHDSPTRTYGDKFAAITVYSSADLVNWTFENRIATTQTKLWIPASTDINGDYFSRMQTLDEASWLGRLGVSYNENTGKYVLLVQFKNPYDDPSADPSAGVLFLQGDSPTADFEYANLQPQIENVGHYGTGDQTVFTDIDGTDYLIFSNRFGRANGYVSKISDEDSLSIEPAVNVWPRNGGREGNAMFRLGDTYYMAASDLHGWNTSVTHMVHSDQIQDGYSSQYVLPGTEMDYSHVTQTGFFITVRGTEQDTVVFAGDRWADFAWNGIGYNQWMPLSETEDGLAFNSLSNWELNAVTGEWRVGASNNYVLNPDFAADRIAVNEVTGWTTTVDPESETESFVSNVSPGAEASRWALQLGSTEPFSGSVSQRNDAPDGIYRFALNVNTDGGFEYARAIISSGEDERYSLDLNSTTSGWQEFALDDLVLTGDPVTVSIEARSSQGGQSIAVDHLSLVQQEIDRTELIDAVNVAEQLDREIYSASSWSALREALEHAERVLSSATAAQTEVDDAAAELNSVVDQLESAVVAVDVSVSRTKYSVGEEFDASTLTAAATFADGSARTLSADEIDISGFSSASPGHRQVTVSVLDELTSEGSPRVSAAFDVEITASAELWDPRAVYIAGDHVTFDGSLWEASWWTQGQRPGDPHGPWQQLITDEQERALWTASRIFNTGDRVVHEGNEYIAKWWTRNQEPGDIHGPWQPAD